MIVEIEQLYQITIPAEILKKLNLKEGDLLEVTEENGCLVLRPVVIYPKTEMIRIGKLVKEAENECKSDNSKIYDDVNKMLLDMGIDIDNI